MRSTPSSCRRSSPLKRHEIEKARAANPGYGGDGWHDQVTEWERGQFLFLA